LKVECCIKAEISGTKSGFGDVYISAARKRAVEASRKIKKICWFVFVNLNILLTFALPKTTVGC